MMGVAIDVHFNAEDIEVSTDWPAVVKLRNPDDSYSRVILYLEDAKQADALIAAIQQAKKHLRVAGGGHVDG